MFLLLTGAAEHAKQIFVQLEPHGVVAVDANARYVVTVAGENLVVGLFKPLEVAANTGLSVSGLTDDPLRTLVKRSKAIDDSLVVVGIRVIV
jgi:hypothetical protein